MKVASQSKYSYHSSSKVVMLFLFKTKHHNESPSHDDLTSCLIFVSVGYGRRYSYLLLSMMVAYDYVPLPP